MYILYRNQTKKKETEYIDLQTYNNYRLQNELGETMNATG